VRIAELLAGEYALARHNIEPAQTMTVLTLNNVARSLADIFKQDNSRFDRQRFYDACGSDLTA
jgi:hypothetical protein